MADGRSSRLFFGRLNRPVLWAAVLGALTLGLLCVCGAYVLWEGRQEAVAQSDLASENIAEAINQDISRNFEMFDLSLQGVVAALREPELQKLTGRVRQLALFDNSATATYLNRILVLNEKGDVVEDSRSPAPALKQNFAASTFLQYHRQTPEGGLYLSDPERSADTAPGGWIITLSRRISNPDGSFAGVVVGSVQVDYFQNLLENLKTGPHGTLGLLKTDGLLIARKPYLHSAIGSNLSRSALFKNMFSQSIGHVETEGVVDGFPRRFTFRGVTNLPLIVTVGASLPDVYASWQRRALIVVVVIGALIFMIAALALLLRKELQQRWAFEKELALKASTDPLTGLLNRRAFDEAAVREWERAKRLNMPLTAIMVDVDFFKAYNDHHGHISGDDALQRVAQCICRDVTRATDVVARFGGEEFVIMLSDTTVFGGALVAERIRRSIVELEIAHPKSKAKLLTASFGVASISPTSGQALSMLVASADAALYRAKEAGRNRVVRFDPDTTIVQFALTA